MNRRIGLFGVSAARRSRECADDPQLHAFLRADEPNARKDAARSRQPCFPTWFCGWTVAAADPGLLGLSVRRAPGQGHGHRPHGGNAFLRERFVRQTARLTKSLARTPRVSYSFESVLHGV